MSGYRIGRIRDRDRERKGARERAGVRDFAAYALNQAD